MNTIASISTPTTINLTGFRRENGRVGIRNHVVILPVDDLSNDAAEGTASLVNNTIVHFFTTGQGNVIGNPILPVIKICANSLTIQTMAEHIDVDLTRMLRLELTLDQAADIVMDMMARTINGRLTAAEVLRHEEFVLTKLYRSA